MNTRTQVIEQEDEAKSLQRHISMLRKIPSDGNKICAVKNTEKIVIFIINVLISQIVDDVTFIKNFIVGYYMRLSMFKNFNSLKLFFVALKRFDSIIVMLKRFRSLKKGLQEMVTSEAWSSYKEDNLNIAQFVKETC